jgi:GAF domain-containing protein
MPDVASATTTVEQGRSSMMSPSDRHADSAALRAAAELLAAEEYERLEAAAALTNAETEESELRVLVAAREHLDMDVSYCSHLTVTEQIIQRAHGDAGALGLATGTRYALADSYRQRVVDGGLPSLIVDARRDARVTDLVPTLGAYVGVPVVFSDGRRYGTLCCASGAPAPWLGDRDIAFMRVMGRMLAHELERSEIQRAAQHHRNEAIALGALFAGLDARDSYTGRHSEQVVDLAVGVTRALGLPEEFVEEVKRERIVASIASLAPLAPAIRAEHERCDGTGYPDALTREQIPLASRITFACDAYHAMISSRPYRPMPMDSAAAAAELRAKAGTQFDPEVIVALLHVVEA